MSAILSVENLTIRFKTDEGLVTAVEDVNFEIAPGEVLGLVGESGIGKIRDSQVIDAAEWRQYGLRSCQQDRLECAR